MDWTVCRRFDTSFSALVNEDEISPPTPTCGSISVSPSPSHQRRRCIAHFMQKQLWVIINPEFMTLAESSLRVGGKFCTLGSEQSRVSRFPRVKFAYGRKRSDFFPRCVRREDHDRRTQTQARGQRSGRKFVEKESCLKSLSGARLASNFQWFTKRRAEVRGDIATAEFTSNMAGAARVRCSRLQPVVSSRPLLAVKILPNPAQSGPIVDFKS